MKTINSPISSLYDECSCAKIPNDVTFKFSTALDFAPNNDNAVIQ